MYLSECGVGVVVFAQQCGRDILGGALVNLKDNLIY